MAGPGLKGKKNLTRSKDTIDYSDRINFKIFRGETA